MGVLLRVMRSKNGAIPAAAAAHLLANCVAAVLLVSCCSGVNVAPPSSQTNHTRKLLQTQNKIVGPDATFITSEYDYNALIQVQQKAATGSEPRIYISVCTGTLISESHVLTAAHCCKAINENYNFEAMDVTIGAYKLEVDTRTLEAGIDAEGASYQVLYAIHLSYPQEYDDLLQNHDVNLKLKYDICVVTLKEPVRYKAPAVLVDPATLNEADLAAPLPIGHHASIYGWGRQNDLDGSQPVTKLSGLATKTSTCEVPGRSWIDNRWPTRQPPALGPPEFICIDSPADVGGPCAGDAGGPLLVENVVWGVLTTLTTDQTSCMAPGTFKVEYVNLAAPRIADFIRSEMS